MIFLINIQQRLLGNVLYKFSLIFCSLYVVLFFGKIEDTKILFYLFISMLLSIGIAGIGYTFNDIKDFKNDIQNNKQNLFINFSKAQSVSLVIIFIICAVFPWYYLPFDKISFYLLSIEFILFYIYAFPPFRFKEKGILGIITDSLYAQVIPCLLAVYTFSKLSTININLYFIALYASWLFIVGIRNIIKHQIVDFENDQKTNTNTFVIKHGIEYAKKITIVYFFALEIMLFIAILWIINLQYHIVVFIYLLYLIFLIIKRNNNYDSRYNFINTRILNEFYEIHLPIILLLYFSFYNSFYLFVLFLNLLFFYPIYWQFLKTFYQKYFL